LYHRPSETPLEAREEALVGFSAFLVTEEHFGCTFGGWWDQRGQCGNEQREGRLEVDAVGRKDNVGALQLGERFCPSDETVKSRSRLRHEDLDVADPPVEFHCGDA